MHARDYLATMQQQNINIYQELLYQLHVDERSMQDILCAIAKQPNSRFTYKDQTSNFKIIHFEDENGHLFPIPLEKIVEVRNMLFQITGGKR